MSTELLRFDNLIERIRGRKIFVVCGRALLESPRKESLEEAADCVFYDRIMPNPDYEQIRDGVDAFRRETCDIILAVGGGSVIDTAKCVKLFARMPQDSVYYQNPFEDNEIELLAAPTTAGSGSEATQFAVIYVDGVKKSIDHRSIRPSEVYFIPEFLRTLPEYQRASTMLDALCHSIESVWSVNATQESREYAAQAMKLLWKWKEAYLANAEDGNAHMLQAANYAGKAINISKTTACHAMSYKLTKKYGISHGYAAALSLEGVWDILEDYDQEKNRFILSAAGIEKAELFAYVDSLLGNIRKDLRSEQIRRDMEELVSSVDINRLKNMPVKMERKDIEAIYAGIGKE